MVQLINKEQLAEVLLLSPQTVQTYAKRSQWDKIPPPVKVGGRNRWDIERVESWIREKQLGGGSGTEPKRNASV